jgi:hypothetical protein
LSVLSLLNQRGSSDVIPHLSGHHGEDEEQRHQAPHVLVVQELQVISPEVQESGNLNFCDDVKKME